MNNRTVNLAFFYRLLDPISGGAEVEEIGARHSWLSDASEQQFRAWVRQAFSDHMSQMHPEVVQGCRLALEYTLSSDAHDPGSKDAFMEGMWDNQMPSFDPPTGLRAFFYLLWEVCFPGEDVRLRLEECFVIDDANLIYPEVPRVGGD